MARVPSLRASDFDREQVAERLRHAAVEGRLTTDELEERVEAVSAARTYGELDALVADLPVSTAPRPPRLRVERWVLAAAATTVLLAVLGMVAGAARHFAEALGDHPGPYAHWHQLMNAAASMATVLALVVVFAVVLICGTLLWRSRRSRRASHRLNSLRG